MNTVVFGEDIYTSVVIESLLEKGHKVLLIISPRYRNDNYKVLEETASRYNITFIIDENVNSGRIKDQLEKTRPDLIIAVHLRKILHREIFCLAAKGAINVHPSLLPKYRGLSPQHQAILHGDNESGVTVHFIDEDVDTGEIIIQKKFPVLKDDYILQIQSKMLVIYKEIVVEALHIIEEGSFKPVKQDLAKASYFGPLKRADRQINMSMTKEEVYKLIRAVSLPYQGAFYKNYTIWTAFLPDSSTEAQLHNKYSEMGFYYDKTSHELIIRLKDGFLVSEDYEMN